MKKTVRRLLIGSSWLYAAFMMTWFVLHTLWGDDIWWLALLNIFAPHLFSPLLVLLPLCFIVHKWSYYFSLVLPLSLFLWLYGLLFLPSWPTSSEVDKAAFSIMTFNVWGGSHSIKTAQVIRESGLPDIVLLQELRPRLVDHIIAEVGDIYPYRVVSIPGRGNGLGVFSRYPLIEISRDNVTFYNREVQVVKALIDGQQIIIYNLHLHSSNIITFLRFKQDVIGWIENSFAFRKSHISQMLKDIKKHSGPVIIVGDFNSTDRSDVYAMLTDELIDAHQAVGWGFGHTFPAYSGRYRRWPIPSRQVRIDMIFYSDHLAALQTHVGTSYGESDHRPVLATLAWRHTHNEIQQTIGQQDK